MLRSRIRSEQQMSHLKISMVVIAVLACCIFAWAQSSEDKPRETSGKKLSDPVSLQQDELGDEIVDEHKWVEHLTVGKLDNSQEALANVHDLKKLDNLAIKDIDIETARQFAEYDSLRTLDIRHPVDPEVLKIFASLSNLRQIEFHQPDFPDAYGKALAASQSLKTIRFWNLEKDVSGLKFLRKTNVDRLFFHDSQLDKSSFETITSLRSLKSLSAKNCTTARGDISPLNRCLTIQTLSFQDSKITDEDIRSLGLLSRLGSLDISGTDVTSASMKYVFKNFPALHTLHAVNAGFDASIIPMLEKRQNLLRYVSVSSASISKAQAKAAIPRVAEMLQITD